MFYQYKLVFSSLHTYSKEFSNTTSNRIGEEKRTTASTQIYHGMACGTARHGTASIYGILRVCFAPLHQQASGDDSVTTVQQRQATAMQTVRKEHSSVATTLQFLRHCSRL